MKVIIAGSRSVKMPTTTMLALVESGFFVTEVVCGGALGPDTHGRKWAEQAAIPVKMFSADWNRHGRAAGMIRNRQMAEYADALVAVWDGVSKGTANMIAEANKRGLKVYVKRTDL